jgi:hypothetical protein
MSAVNRKVTADTNVIVPATYPFSTPVREPG